MRKFGFILLVIAVLAISLFAGVKPARADEQNSIVIVFKDGTQKTFAMADIARIEFNGPKSAAGSAGQGRFLGKWRVGDGSGSKFTITLDRDGEANKSIGSTHGKWVVVGGEARISWDDGWHDSIRKTGSKYEKVAFGPGKSFSDSPDNVTGAERTEPSPI
jgi:hypothetical protein